MQQQALAQCAMHIPVGGESARIAALLNLIRMTATLDAIPISITMDGARDELPSALPAEQFLSYLCIDRADEIPVLVAFPLFRVVAIRFAERDNVNTACDNRETIFRYSYKYHHRH
jgi:hypothetical protein